MKLIARHRNAPAPPGILGTVRVERRTRVLLPRLSPGDIAVLDHLDLDRATAQSLADRGVSAVINTSAFISGRYPNLGPELLIEAGIELVEADARALGAVRDGARARLHEGELFVGDEAVLVGQVLDAPTVRERMLDARQGLVDQLSSFTHNSSEFLRREEDLLLHGLGAPRLATRIAHRPVVVVVAGHEHTTELAGIRRYLREQDPVLIGVDRGADALLAAGLTPDIVVMNAGHGADEHDEAPSAKALRAARDVVVRVDRGGARISLDHVERLVSRPLRCETGATAEDVALLVADLEDASLIVGVGMHATLDEFLDRQRSGLASTFLTRLKVGPRLVDAGAVPQLYSGRTRPWHLWLVLVSCLLALAAAIGVTPVGQLWLDDLAQLMTALLDDLQGLFR
ncbi:putative cytokinetic ring protein SteA [Nocardioides sp.]|uniref:putative cytokinetic ring protein SteA n=1 Tax=Nocardioides sp. TaxID=35761 RepID=UPI0027323D54|nr:putative cytokinetic ring protein SteA [Nocardioides sp.]MDP3892880.1 putative cytokinetic ring protein SteA [Nocardioides sp.]